MSLTGWLFIAAFAQLSVVFALIGALCRDVSRLQQALQTEDEDEDEDEDDAAIARQRVYLPIWVWYLPAWVWLTILAVMLALAIFDPIRFLAREVGGCR